MPLLLLIPFFLASCSEDLIYNDAKYRVTIEVLNASDTTIKVGDSILFQAKINPSFSDVEPYYWTISPNTRNRIYNHTFSRRFDTSGIYEVKFYAIDFLKDTLSAELTINVSSPPFCEDNISIKIFQGSPIFKWECHDPDGGELTYKLIYKEKDKARPSQVGNIKTDSLQLGAPLNYDSLEITLIATNKHGIETQLDSIWSVP